MKEEIKLGEDGVKKRGVGLYGAERNGGNLDGGRSEKG